MPTKITMTALLAASLTGNIYLLSGGKYEQVAIKPDTITSALLEAADPECVALVGEGATCHRGRTHLGDDPDWTEGWECDGRWMSKKVQTCLDAAAEKLPPEPVEIEP